MADLGRSDTDQRRASARAAALERFEKQTALPMLILSIAIVPLLILPLVLNLPSGLHDTFIALDWFIWAVFAVEYGVRLFLSADRGRFVKTHVLDLIVVLLPLLRPLRIVRSARALRVLRAARAATFLLRGIEAAHRVLTRHNLHYALLVSLVAVVGAAVLVESFERGAEGANIGSLTDALWWAVVTVATVGYGDRFPVTAGGRGIAVVLMLLGIGLFGFLAGSLASYFFEQSEERSDDRLDEMAQRLERIEATLDSLAADRPDRPTAAPEAVETQVDEPNLHARSL